MANNSLHKISRREFFLPFMASGIALGMYNPFSKKASGSGYKKPIRQFHISMSTESIEKYPDLPSIARDAGITDVWIGAAFFAKLRRPAADLRKQADMIEKLGMKAHLITLPLGHPSDPVGTAENPAARSAPSHWKNGCTYEGTLYSGTSIHSPAVAENAEVLRVLDQHGFDSVFLDDDFRIGRYPGSIGGCFCDDCREDFLKKYGYGDSDWDELIESATNRNPTQILRTWIDHNCDIEYDMFVALQKAVPRMELGIMVMYFGSEKAGIALDRYQDVPFRVGELMFKDESFGHIKGKTDELFSVLFHRRFIKPNLAYSETTVFPQAAFSARNMAAKLSISLIADVRNTMFMSGINPIPMDYWELLKPAMKKSALYHEEIAGHKPAGPFKHFWGWDSRLVGRDKPFSLFLASGIPFEVTEELSAEGWTFLSDEDAIAVTEGRLDPVGKNLVIRDNVNLSGDHFIPLAENLDELFKFKNQIIPDLIDIPHIEGKIPAIFAWYPSAGKGLIWNVTEEKQSYTIKRNEKILQTVSVNGLDVMLINNI